MEDARIVRSKQALQNALLSLIDHKPLEDITIREIAIEAGVHYTTFYRHRASKETLLDEIAASQISRLVELTTPMLHNADGHSVHLALCQYVDKHRKLWTTLLTGGAAVTMKNEFIRLSIKTAEERVAKDSDIPIELIVMSTVSVIIDILAWWLAQPRGAVTIERVAELMDKLVFTTLK